MRIVDDMLDCVLSRRRTLRPQKLWLGDYQRNADTRGILTPEKCWYQNNADTRTLLIPELFWHQNFTGTRILLTLDLC
jgi:hypothetical protein